MLPKHFHMVIRA
jgi:hypothetical protein